MHVEIATEYYPRLTKWHVRRALKWINPVDLAGIEFIRLMDDDPTDPNARKQPAYLRNPFYSGQYVKKNNRSAAHINLFTRNLYLGIPLLFKLTPVATLITAFILAHEVAHHLVTYRHYIYEPTEKYKAYGTYDEYEEGMADNYAYDVMRKMSANLYYRLGFWLRRILFKYFFEYGAIVWEKHEYKKAAYYWFCAFRMERDNLDATYWYQRAVKMVNNR